jgi:hypothetical protein
MLPPDLPLLILQQEPADSLARLGSDREQASLLRAVAGVFFEAGCQAIVVIPSLPPELAELVTKRITRRITVPKSGISAVFRRLLKTWRGQNASQGGLRDLATAVRDARDAIFAWPGFESAPPAEARAGGAGADYRTGQDPDEQREVAWDLCLFARLPFDKSAPAEPGHPRERVLD